MAAPAPDTLPDDRVDSARANYYTWPRRLSRLSSGEEATVQKAQEGDDDGDDDLVKMMASIMMQDMLDAKQAKLAAAVAQAGLMQYAGDEDNDSAVEMRIRNFFRRIRQYAPYIRTGASLLGRK